jgi:hypothetical protein
MSWQAEQCKALAQHYLAAYGAEDTILADLMGERLEGAAEDWIDEWFGRTRSEQEHSECREMADAILTEWRANGRVKEKK